MPFAGHDLIVYKLGAAGSLIGGALSVVIQAVQNMPISFWQTVISVFGAGLVSISALVLKEWLDRRKAGAALLYESRKADGIVSIERDKLIDARVDALFDDMTAFYQLRDKEKDTLITMLKSALDMKDEVIQSQRVVIAQQAALLVPPTSAAK
jgi:hypothetical protein